MDQDLEDMLDELWKKHPYPDEKYLNLRAKLLIVQELRNINAKLSNPIDVREVITEASDIDD